MGGDGNLLATILSVVGALTGVAGAITGVAAFLANQVNHDAEIFREEFARHRLALESSLQVIKRHLVVLRGSARPVQPIATIETNFAAVRHETIQAVATILSEADEIDLRSLTSARWVPSISAFETTIQANWETVADPTATDLVRLQAAQTIVANLDGLSLELRGLIDRCVKASLNRKRWLKKV